MKKHLKIKNSIKNPALLADKPDSKFQSGFTLIEMVATVSIFVIVITLATGVLVAIIRTQRRNNAQRTIQQEAKNVLDTITREAKLVSGSDTYPPFTVGNTGNVPDSRNDAYTEGNQLILTNDSNIKTYFLDISEGYGIVKVTEGSDPPNLANAQNITSENVNVTELKFEVSPYSVADTAAGEVEPKVHPFVNITLSLESRKDTPATRVSETLRTSVSSLKYSYVQNAPIPQQPTLCSDSPPSPISYWNLDEGSGITASDLEGNNEGYLKYNGDLDGDGTSNGPIWTSSGNARIGNSALRYDGDDYVRIPDDSSLDIGGDITIETWAKFSDLDSKQAIVGKCEGYAGYSVRINQNGVGERYVSFKYEGIGKSWSSVDPAIWEDYRYVVTNNNVTINDTEWFHIVAVKEGTEMKLYINGGNKATLTDVIPYNKEGLSDPEEFNNNYDLFFGGDPQGSLPGSQNYPFNGKNDEIKIYDVALNDDQICNIYNNAPSEPEPPPPPPPGGFSNVKTIAAGGGWHSLAIDGNDTVWGTGYNMVGELGLGDPLTTDIEEFTQTSFNNVSAVTAGTAHSLAIKTDGTLWASGRSNDGALGLGGTLEVHEFTQITQTDPASADNDWSKVVTKNEHTLAIKTDGTLWATGRNDSGQLGLGDEGTATDRNIFTQVSLANVSDIAVGNEHSVVLLSGGTIWTCGASMLGQLGYSVGGNKNKTTFTQAATINNVADIDSGGAYSLAIKSNGTLWGTGSNYYGELGLGDSGPGTDRFQFTQITQTDPVSAINDFTAFVAGNSHTLALKSDGTVWTCGRNWYGELGLGNFDNKNLLTQTNLDSVSAIVGGYDYSVALKSNGTVWTCGLNDHGQLGLGVGTIGTDVNIFTQASP